MFLPHSDAIPSPVNVPGPTYLSGQWEHSGVGWRRVSGLHGLARPQLTDNRLPLALAFQALEPAVAPVPLSKASEPVTGPTLRVLNACRLDT